MHAPLVLAVHRDGLHPKGCVRGGEGGSSKLGRGRGGNTEYSQARSRGPREGGARACCEGQEACQKEGRLGMLGNPPGLLRGCPCAWGVYYTYRGSPRKLVSMSTQRLPTLVRASVTSAMWACGALGADRDPQCPMYTCMYEWMSVQNAPITCHYRLGSSQTVKTIDYRRV